MEINQRGQAVTDRKALVERDNVYLLSLKLSILFNRRTLTERRYGMNGALDLTPLSQSPHPRQGDVFLVCTKYDRISLKLCLKRLRNFPSLVKSFFNLLGTVSSWLISFWFTYGIGMLDRGGLIVMLYPYKFIYDYKTVPKRHISGYLNSFAQCERLTWTRVSHQQSFQRHFHSQFTNADCHSSKFDAVFSKESWPTINSRIETPESSFGGLRKVSVRIAALSIVLYHLKYLF